MNLKISIKHFWILGLLGVCRVEAATPAPHICYRALEIIQGFSKSTDIQNTQVAFRNSLDVSSPQGKLVAQEKVFGTLLKWLTEKKGFIHLGPKELLVDGNYKLANGSTLKIVSVPVSNPHGPYPDFWAFRLEHAEHGPDAIDGRKWIVDVGISLIDSTVTLQTAVRYYQALPQLGLAPPAPVLGPPKFVKDLLQATEENLVVSVGNFSVKESRPLGIKKIEQFQKFVNLLTNPKRRVPLFVLSYDYDGGRYALDPSVLGRKLWGIAPVFYETPEFNLIQGFVEGKLPQALSVHSGALRIYMPHFDPSDKFERHSLITLPVIERMIQNMGESSFVNHLAAQSQGHVDQTQFVYNVAGAEYLRAQLSIDFLRAKMMEVGQKRPLPVAPSAPPASAPLEPVSPRIEKPVKPKEIPFDRNAPKKQLPKPDEFDKPEISVSEPMGKLRGFNLEREIDKLKTEKAELLRQIDLLRAENTKKDGLVAELNQMHEDLMQIGSEVGSHNLTLQARLEALESAKMDLEIANDALKEQVAALQRSFIEVEGFKKSSGGSNGPKFTSALSEKFPDLEDVKPTDPFSLRKKAFLLEVPKLGPRYTSSDLIVRFEELFSDRVLILDSAKKSTEIHPMNNSYLSEMLVGIAEVAWSGKFEKNLNGRPFHEHVSTNLSGYKYSNNEGKETMRKYGHYRLFELPIEGKTVEFTGHLKQGINRNGALIRIYFGFDESFPGQVIFGHIGDHLPSISDDNY